MKYFLTLAFLFTGHTAFAADPLGVQFVACKASEKPMGFTAQRFKLNYYGNPELIHLVTPHYSVPATDLEPKPSFRGQQWLENVDLRSWYNTKLGISFEAGVTRARLRVVEQRKGKNGVKYYKLTGNMAVHTDSEHEYESTDKAVCYAKESTVVVSCTRENRDTCVETRENLIPLYNRLKQEFDRSSL